MKPLEMALKRADEPYKPDCCAVCPKFRVVGTAWFCGVSGKLLIPKFAAEIAVCGGKRLSGKETIT